MSEPVTIRDKATALITLMRRPRDDWMPTSWGLTLANYYEQLEARLREVEADRQQANVEWAKYEHAMKKRAEKAEATVAELEAGLLDTYWLIREGEPDNALHALDAYLIRHGINPEKEVL